MAVATTAHAGHQIVAFSEVLPLVAGELGGFNWSSQHRVARRIEDRRSALLQESSTPASCLGCCWPAWGAMRPTRTSIAQQAFCALYSRWPTCVAALRVSCRETVEGLQPMLRAISRTPTSWACRSPISYLGERQAPGRNWIRHEPGHASTVSEPASAYGLRHANGIGRLLARDPGGDLRSELTLNFSPKRRSPRRAHCVSPGQLLHPASRSPHEHRLVEGVAMPGWIRLGCPDRHARSPGSWAFPARSPSAAQPAPDRCQCDHPWTNRSLGANNGLTTQPGRARLRARGCG